MRRRIWIRKCLDLHLECVISAFKRKFISSLNEFIRNVEEIESISGE